MNIKYINARRVFWLSMMVVFYILLRVLGGATNEVVAYSAQVIRHSFMIALAAIWDTSIQRRITNRRVRHYLLHIGGAIALWLTFRAMSLYVFESELALRYLWYCTYIPLVSIAFFAYAISVFVGKSDNYRIPRGIYFSFFLSIVFLLGIMTNEHHHQAMRIDPVTGAKAYGWLYYVSVAWEIGMLFAAIITVPKHRDEGIKLRKLVIPYGLTAFGLLFSTLYFVPATYRLVGKFDYTITLCITIILVWESIIQGGFIQGNKDYDWCFKNSTIRAQILDTKGDRIFQSHISRPLGEDDWYILSQYGHFKPDRNTEMLLARIRGGYVIWEKDIHDINYTMDNLLETRENIRSATMALQETIDEEIKHNKIKEQNRLYDKVSAGVGPKFEVLSMCIKFAQTATDNDLRMLIRRIDIVGVYAKRKSNLILLSEKSDADFNMELELCFKETFDNLNQGSVDATFRVRMEDKLLFEEAVLIYDLMQLTLEAALDSVKGIMAIVSGNDRQHILTMSMTLETEEDCKSVSAHLHEKMEYDCELDDEIEDNIINVSFIIPAVGGKEV